MNGASGTKAEVAGDSSGRSFARWRAAVAIFAFFAIAMVAIMARDLKRYPKTYSSFHHGQIKSPVLAIEVASNREYLAEPLLQAKSPAQSLKDAGDSQVEQAAKMSEASEAEKMRWNQAMAVRALRLNTLQDCVFIPLYTGLLLSLSLVFTADVRTSVQSETEGKTLQLRQHLAARRWLGRFGAGLAVLIAVFDYAENYGILSATTASTISDELARRTSVPSLAKWTSLGLDLLLVAVIIWLSQLPNFRKWVRWLLGAAFAIVGFELVVATQWFPLFQMATPSFAGVAVISAAGLLGPFFKRLPDRL